MKSQRFDSVWQAIEDTSESACMLELRSSLMWQIKDHIHQLGWPDDQCAKLLGVTAPRLSELLHGKIDRFGLDDLVCMAARAGLRVQVQVRPTSLSPDGLHATD